MKKKNLERGNDNSEVDITPMLDVVFIMLIFFVVTASFVKEEDIGLAVAPEHSNNIAEEKPILLSIDANNQISIDGRNVDLRAITSIIVRMKAERPDASVAVNVNGKANTKTIIGAVDGIRSANILYPSIKIKAS